MYGLGLEKLYVSPEFLGGCLHSHAWEEFHIGKTREEETNVTGLGLTASLAHCLATKSIELIYLGRWWTF